MRQGEKILSNLKTFSFGRAQEVKTRLLAYNNRRQSAFGGLLILSSVLSISRGFLLCVSKQFYCMCIIGVYVKFTIVCVGCRHLGKRDPLLQC